MKDLHWSQRALDDWNAIQDFIARDNPAAAERIGAEILHAFAIVQRYPNTGRMGRVAGTRELVITGTPYLAAYKVFHDAVCVITIRHGAQKWPSRFSEESDRKPQRKN